MSEKPGFIIAGTFYPVPDRYTLGDTNLVKEITGLDFNEFASELRDGNGDPTIISGVIAVIVKRENPRWKNDRVIAYTNLLTIDDIEFVAPADSGDDLDPPAQAGEASGSSTSPATSMPSPEALPAP